MKFRLLALVLIICSTISTSGQEQAKQKQFKPLEDFDIVSLSYVNYGKSEFKKDNQVGEVGFSEFRFSYTTTKLLNNRKTVLIHGLEFTNLKPDFSEVPNSSPITRNFYSAAYRFGIINPIGKKGWRYSLGLKPTLASDFEEGGVSSEDFILQASVLFSKRASENFKYGFGVSFNTRFGQKQILPIFQLVYKKNNWTTFAYLPAYLGHFYNFNSSKLGLSINLNGNNYNFHNTNTSGLDLDKLSYSRVNIGPEYEIKITKKIKLNLNGGVTIANKLDWLNGNDDSELDLSPENKFFFKLGFKLVK
ncbi:MAG: hypothetical protein COB60_05670 [Flavobacteriaceae bacterium]|nr:MAG: hypothetical protein COB60_05670 [Flavobacteriaceae bacterium]